MDTLYKLFLKKRLVDLELRLDDGTNKLILNVHKILFIEHSPFFEKLLTFGDDDPKTLTIEVANSYVAFDVMLSIYGQNSNTSNLSGWPLVLAIAKCRDYFCLEPLTYDIPKDIEVYDYDTILELCSIVGFNESNLLILTDNLPLDYDTTKLSNEYVQQIIKNKISYSIISHTRNVVTMWDIQTGEITNTFKHYSSNIEYTVISSNNKYILIKGEDDCNVWDLESQMSKFSLGKCSKAVFSPDGTTLAIEYRYQYHIIVKDLLTGNTTSNLGLKQLCKFFAFVPFSHNNLLVIVEDDSVKIWNKNLNTTTILLESTCDHISFSSNGKYLEISHERKKTYPYADNPKIWNVSTEIPVEIYKDSIVITTSFQRHDKAINFIYKNCTDYVVIAGKVLEIHDVNNNSLIYFIDTYGQITFSPNNLFIMLYKRDNDEKHYNTEIRNIITGKEHFRSDCIHHFSSSKFLAELDSKHIQFWDISNNCIIPDVKIRKPKLMAFTPNERYFIASYNSSVKIYSLPDGKLVNEIDIDIKNISLNVYYNNLCQKLLEQKID